MHITWQLLVSIVKSKHPQRSLICYLINILFYENQNCFFFPLLKCVLECRNSLGSDVFSSPCCSARFPSSFPWFSSCLQNTVSGRILVPRLQVWTVHFWLIKAQSMLLQTKTASFTQRKNVSLNKHQGRDPVMTVGQIICAVPQQFGKETERCSAEWVSLACSL